MPASPLHLTFFSACLTLHNEEKRKRWREEREEKVNEKKKMKDEREGTVGESKESDGEEKEERGDTGNLGMDVVIDSRSTVVWVK